MEGERNRLAGKGGKNDSKGNGNPKGKRWAAPDQQWNKGNDWTQWSQPPKGKGRGKRSDQTQQQPQPPSQSSFFDRFRTSFSGPSGANADSQSVHSEQQSTSHQSQHSGNDPPSYADATATTKTVYIKQVDLLLNGAPLDQLDTRETGK